MKFKVGDIIKPKNPEGPEEWYDVKYRIISISGSSDYPTVTMEVLIDEKKMKELKEEAEHNIDVNFEGWPPWVEYEVKVNVSKTFVDYLFDEDEYELVEGM